MKNARIIFVGIFMFCAVMCGISFYYNLIEHIPLCPLCAVQVICFYIIALYSLIRFVIIPNITWRYVGAFFMMIMSLLGLAAASRQLWIAHLSLKNNYPCAPDILHPFNSFSISQVISSVFKRYNDCILQNWHFLGLSMPAWSLIAFIVLFAINCFLVYEAAYEQEIEL